MAPLIPLKAACPSTLPIIDIRSSYSTSIDVRKQVAEQIRHACTTSGFFYITGHGVPDELLQDILNLARTFFRLMSPAQKEAMHVQHSTHFRGWESGDYTHQSQDDQDRRQSPETKESFNFGYEPRLDPTGGDGAIVEMDGQATSGNVWPPEDTLPGFRATIQDYYGEILTLARHLLGLFSLSFGLPEDYFYDKATHPGGTGRLMYYPPATSSSSPNHEESKLGLGAHTDYECFTILLCSSTPGLEIFSAEEGWTAAPEVPGSFIINVADMMVRWTNGVYLSRMHRVINRTGAARYSVPFFFSINYDQIIETLPQFVTAESPSKFSPIQAGEYLQKRLQANVKQGDLLLSRRDSTQDQLKV